MSTPNYSPNEPPVPKAIADAAAQDLEACTDRTRLIQATIPWLYPPPGRTLSQRVTDAWFKVRAKM